MVFLLLFLFLITLPIIICRLVSDMLFTKVKRLLSDENILNIDMFILSRFIKNQGVLLFFLSIPIVGDMGRPMSHFLGYVFGSPVFWTRDFMILLILVGICSFLDVLKLIKDDFRINNFKFRIRLSFTNLFMRSFFVSVASVIIYYSALMLLWYIMY